MSYRVTTRRISSGGWAAYCRRSDEDGWFVAAASPYTRADALACLRHALRVGKHDDAAVRSTHHADERG